MLAVAACVVASLGAAGPAAADLTNTYTFSVPPSELFFLRHSYYYEWDIAWKPMANEVITGATLTITNLWEYAGDPLNRLWVHLLDTPTRSWTADDPVVEKTDPDNGYVDFFAAAGPMVLDYTQKTGAMPVTLTLDLGNLDVGKSPVNVLPQLAAFAADGRFAFGIDPDCAFVSDRFTLNIVTAVVPVPGAAMLGALGLGLAGSAARRRGRVQLVG